MAKTDMTKVPSRRTFLHVFPSFAVGGSQIRTITLANAFAAGDYPNMRHAIVSIDDDTAALERLNPDVDANIAPIKIEKNRAISVGNIQRFRALFKKLQPDVLCTYNWGSIEAALAYRLGSTAQHVHFEDGFGPDESADRQHPRRIAMRRLALGKKSTLIAASTTLQDLATKRWGFPAARVRHIPNGVDLDAFAEPADVHSFRRHPDEIIIGSVGALRPEKNIPRLLQAIKDLKGSIPVRLIIVGDGAIRADLEARARELKIDNVVEFAGYASDTAGFYSGFDIFALSSDTEQMPISAIEAMAAGRPVMSTDVGDLSAMLAPDNRNFLTPLGDETAYIQSLTRLALDEEMRHRLGAANRRRAAELFSRDRMITAYAVLFGLA